ncbi:MAG: hypothetical protein ACFFDS_04030 [Candidatus Thorarchaeota archaeon]
MSEEEIETPYLSEEIHLKKITPLRVIWEMFKLTSWQNFAHHPTCSVYKNHYLSIGRIKLCVGCTSLYSMLGVFLIIFFPANNFFRTNVIILPIVYVFGIFTFCLHLLIRPENKWIKVLFRGSLGLGIGAYIAIIVLGPTWWIRLILGILIPIEIALFFIVRGKRANLELCDSCPLHFADPPCDPMKNTEIRAAKINQLIDTQIEGLKRRSIDTKEDVLRIKEDSTKEQVSE